MSESPTIIIDAMNRFRVVASDDDSGDDGPPMSDEITRHELDAKLQTVEAHVDARFKGFEGSIGMLGEKVDSLGRITQLNVEASKATRTQIIIGAIGVIVAVVSMGVAILFGIISYVPGEIQKTIAAFELGLQSRAESKATSKGELTPTPPAQPAKQ